MKINSIDLSRLRNEEHTRFHAGFVELLDIYGTGIHCIETLFPKYISLLAYETEVLSKIEKSESADVIIDAEAHLDSVFSALVAKAGLGTLHYKGENREAATRIQYVLDQYNQIRKKDYIGETTVINNLLNELNTHCTGEVNTLGLGGWLTELQNANTCYGMLMENRSNENEKAGRGWQQMKTVRRKVDAVYRKIVERLNELTSEGLEDYAGFVDSMNECIIRYGLILARREYEHIKEKEPWAVEAGKTSAV